MMKLVRVAVFEAFNVQFFWNYFPLVQYFFNALNTQYSAFHHQKQLVFNSRLDFR